MNLTEIECIESVKFAIGLVADIPYKANSWNAQQFLIKEHCLGWASAGGTVYKCDVGFNIDFDVRCECCGNILVMGSVDIEGPAHNSSPSPNSCVAIARSISELHVALGSDCVASEGLSSEEAGKYIFSRLRLARLCRCSHSD